MKNNAVKILFLILVAVQVTAFAQADNLKEMFDNRQYFDLRDALAKHKNDNSNDLLFYRGAIANRFNRLEESAALLQKYVKEADKNAPHLADAYEILADNYTKEFQYGKAADAYKFLLDNFREKLAAEKIEDFENVFGLWSALRNIAPQTVLFEGDSNIQGTRDVAHLLNIPVEFDAAKENFVFDTGANISTISLSTAQKLGLKIVEADVSVGSSTGIKVKSKLAVAPSMKIGNATLHNAIFLVLEDKELSFPQANYQIHGIVGFPVMQLLGKISIAKDNHVLIPAKQAKTDAVPNMCLEGFMPIVAGFHENKRLSFSFDTGAVSTDLFPLFFKANEARITKDRTSEKTKVGGAGGFKEVMSYRLATIELAIGGKTAKLANTRVLTERTSEDSRYFYGNLGQDLIKQFEKMTLDFRAMQISFE